MIDKLKRDSEENWNKAINFIPKKNEVIIYDYESGPKIKIGDGVTNVINLPFNDDSQLIHIDNIKRVEDDMLIIEGDN